jgi:DNA-binding transcriptional LysR family regulator
VASLEDYAAFVAIVERGSLTAAARQLGRSLQAVSRALASLEQELGIELVQRTTRQSRPTAAGAAFLGRIRTILADLSLARTELSEMHGQVAGRLVVGGPVYFGPSYLTPAIAAFIEWHPAVEIELVLADHYADLVAEGIDLAVRLGDIPDSSLMARRLGALRQVVFGAPGYFAAHGRPAVPADLRRHACVVRTSARAMESWGFLHRGRMERVAVHGAFRTNSPAACNEAAALGMGIATAPLWQVRPLLDQGRIELVLAEFEPPSMPISIVWPPTSALPVRTRLFIDFLAARVAVERL